MSVVVWSGTDAMLVDLLCPEMIHCAMLNPIPGSANLTLYRREGALSPMRKHVRRAKTRACQNSIINCG